MKNEKELTPEQTAEAFTYLRNIANAPAGTPRPPLPAFIPAPTAPTEPWYASRQTATHAREVDLGPEEDRMVFPDDLDLER